MVDPRTFRELLAADLALVMELAPARDIALALQRYWEQREEPGVKLSDELARIASLTPEDVGRLESAVDRFVEEAGGDARHAVIFRGGLDRSLALGLSVVDPPAVEALAEAGATIRAPLREVAEDRYLDFTVIEKGGMGIVYLALDSELNRRVAMKIVRLSGAGEKREESSPFDLTPPGGDTPESEVFRRLTERFLMEAWVTGGLEHPGIVPVYELGRTPEGVPYYTMRFVRGELTLARAIEECRSLEDRLALIEPFLKACDTMSYAHSRGVIHRDLKPANIALGEFGEVVLLDWGLAKFRERPDLSNSAWQDRIREFRQDTDMHTQAGGLGTPGYMAPEALAESPESIDERCDIYSLGAILYRILTGKPTHEYRDFREFVTKTLSEKITPPHERDPSVPEALSHLCMAALTKSPRNRLGKVSDLSDAIRVWQHQSAVQKEIAGHLREAEAAFQAADGLTGADLLRQLDRVISASLRARELSPDQDRAGELLSLAETGRERAIAEREKAARRGMLRRAALGTLVFLLVFAAGVGWLLENRRREAVAARERAESAEAMTGQALRRSRALALAGAAAAAEPVDAMLSLLLARESARLEPLPEVVSQLHRSIFSSLERAEFRGHEYWIMSVAFTPGGERILTSAYDGTARLWDLSGNEITKVEVEDHLILDAELSPDGKSILTLCDEGVDLWNLDGKNLLSIRPGDPGAVRNAALDYTQLSLFSPAGDRIASVGPGNTAHVWNLAGQTVAVLKGHEEGISAIDFSPDGSLLATSSFDGTVRLWDREGRETWAKQAVRRKGMTVWCVRFSPSGDRLLTSAEDAKVRIFDLEGNVVAEMAHDAPRFNEVVYSRWSPDGEQILSTGRDSILWDKEGRRLARLHGHPQGVWHAAFSPSGRLLATGSTDGTTRVWDKHGKPVALLAGHGDMVHSIAFSPDEDSVATASLDRTVRLWTLVPAEVSTFRPHEKDVKSICFSPDGREILTSSEDRTARLHGLDGGRLLKLEGHEDTVYEARMFPAGDRIVTVSGDRTARIWNRKGTELARLPHEAPVFNLDISANGERMATGSGKGIGRVWDSSGKPIVKVGETADSSCAVRLTASGDRLLTEMLRTLHLWDLEGNLLTTYRGMSEWIHDSAISPDGRYVIAATQHYVAHLWAADGREITCGPGGYSVDCSGGEDPRFASVASSRARIWDHTGEIRAVLSGHTDTLHTVDFSPDGRRVVTSCSDGTARIWDLDGKTLAILPCGGRPVSEAWYSPTGSHVATLDRDNTVRVFHANTDDLLELADRRSLRDFSLSELDRYSELLPEEPYRDRIAAYRIVQRALGVTRFAMDARLEVERQDIAPEVRTLAMEMLSKRGDRSSELNGAAWNLAVESGREKADYDRALRWAVEADRRAPENGMILNTLGVAEFRAGRIEEAIQTLTRSRELNGGDDASDLAFLAMALIAADRGSDAEPLLDRLEEQLADEASPPDAEARGYIEEALRAAGRKPAKGD